MTRAVRLGALAFTALFLFSAMTVFVPTALAEMSVRPTVSLSALNPSTTEVVVSPSSIGSAAMTGVVTVTKPPAVGVVTVALYASCSTGWPIIVSPPMIPFNTPSFAPITVTVVVPQATPASHIGKVLISAVASYPGGEAYAASTAVVTVAQYFRVMLQSQQAFIEMPPGSQTVLMLDIMNRGNGADTFSITINNLPELKTTGWTVAASAYAIGSIPMGESDVMKLTAKPKRPWAVWYAQGDVHFIDIRVTSDNAEVQEIMIEKSFVFAIMLRGWYIPTFDITFLMMAMGMIAAFMARYRAKGGYRRPL